MKVYKDLFSPVENAQMVNSWSLPTKELTMW